MYAEAYKGRARRRVPLTRVSVSKEIGSGMGGARLVERLRCVQAVASSSPVAHCPQRRSGGISRGGLALMLPVSARPGDGGLEIAIAGPPREVAGYAIRIKTVNVRIRGVVRRGRKGSSRQRALVTNPRSCLPASTELEVSAYEGPPPQLTQISTFTPTGCS